MASLDEQILRASKEIAVKFIEVGRISPTGFPDTFKTIYQTVEQLVKKPTDSEPAPPSLPDTKTKKKAQANNNT
jgi:hypothetical protein